MKLVTDNPWVVIGLVLAYACGFIYLLREHGNKYPKLTAKRAVVAFLGVLVAGFLLLLGLVSAWRNP